MGAGDKVQADEVIVSQPHFVAQIEITSAVEKILVVIGEGFHGFSADYFVKLQDLCSAGSLKLRILDDDLVLGLSLPVLLSESAGHELERVAKSDCIGCETEGRNAGAVRPGPVAVQGFFAALAV